MWRHLYRVKRRLGTNVIPSIPRWLRIICAGASPSVHAPSPLILHHGLSVLLISFSSHFSFSSFFLSHFSSFLYKSLLNLLRRAEANGWVGAGRPVRHDPWGHGRLEAGESARRRSSWLAGPRLQKSSMWVLVIVSSCVPGNLMRSMRLV
jgi:hypothetical protein